MKNTTLTIIAIVSLSLMSGVSIAESRSGTHRSDNLFLNRDADLPHQIELSQDRKVSQKESNQFVQQKIHQRKAIGREVKSNAQRNANTFDNDRSNRATRR